MLGQSNSSTIAAYVKIKNEDITVTENGIYKAGPKYTGLGTVTVNVAGTVNNQNKTVDPTTSQQAITADAGYSGLGTVIVNAVDNTIDSNIIAANIKSGVTILGVTGNVTELNGTTLEITPTAASQSHTPTSPNNAFTSVSVAGDQNLVAGNIVKDVTIFGVTGSYEGSVINNEDRTFSVDGVYTSSPGYTGLGTVTVKAGSVASSVVQNETTEQLMLINDGQVTFELTLSPRTANVVLTSVTNSIDIVPINSSSGHYIYYISADPMKDYTYTVSAEGYATRTGTISGGTTNFTINLTPDEEQGGSIPDNVDDGM